MRYLVSLGVFQAVEVSKTYCVDSQSLGQKQYLSKTEKKGWEDYILL